MGFLKDFPLGPVHEAKVDDWAAHARSHSDFYRLKLPDLTEVTLLKEDAIGDGVTYGGTVHIRVIGNLRHQGRPRVMLADDPWVRAYEKHKDGAYFERVVTELTKILAIVEIEPGVNGLLPFANASFEARRSLRVGSPARVKLWQPQPERKGFILTMKED